MFVLNFQNLRVNWKIRVNFLEKYNVFKQI